MQDSETNPTARLLRRQTERALRAERYLTEIHRLLYPEEHMTEAQLAEAADSGYLNADGIREWAVDDLEVIGSLVSSAADRGIITPTPKGDTK